MVFQLLLKILHNLFAKPTIPYDKWTIVDSMAAILIIAAAQAISLMSDSDLIDQSKKDYLDYFMCIVLVVSWLRFFIYFLVVRSISRLMLTLYAMVGDTLSFLFLSACYVAIMASLMTTLY